MSTAEAPVLMTSEELLALPDDGMDRELIRGQLRERPMTLRNRWHSLTMTRTGRFLDVWLDSQPPPRGEIHTGDAAYRLSRDPEMTVGIDVAYVSAEVAARSPRHLRLIEGVPILAGEILSPSDTHENIVERIQLFHDAGVQVVWIIDPDLRIVGVHRPGVEAIHFSASQELIGDPKLPGFRVKVADLFGRAAD